MSIAKTNFAPSKKPYAIDLESFSVDSTGKATVRAVWAGRKDGVTFVCEGILWGYGYSDLPDFMARFGPRYGGDFKFRWNGRDMYAPSATFAETQPAVVRLETVLNALPAVPPGYTGWYSINSKP